MLPSSKYYGGTVIEYIILSAISQCVHGTYFRVPGTEYRQRVCTLI